MSNFTAVTQDAELQAELKQAYNDDSIIDYNDGVLVVAGDKAMQAKLASSPDALVYLIQLFELDDSFEQIDNLNPDAALIESAEFKSEFYLAEKSHLMQFMSKFVSDNAAI